MLLKEFKFIRNLLPMRYLKFHIIVRLILFGLVFYAGVALLLVFLQQQMIVRTNTQANVRKLEYTDTLEEDIATMEILKDDVQAIKPIDSNVIAAFKKVKRDFPNKQNGSDKLKQQQGAFKVKKKTLSKTDVSEQKTLEKSAETNNENKHIDKLNTTAMKEFFNLKNNPVNIKSSHHNITSKTGTSPFHFPFLVKGQHICQGLNGPFLVILIPSVHTHIEDREAIRQSWGRSAIPGVWPREGRLNETVRIVFLFGRSKTALGDYIVEFESKTHKDIVQADFVDSYFNLTRKMIMGVRWVSEFCPNAKYILKADEDVFVHVFNLINLLKDKQIKKNGNYYGHTHEQAQVMRVGKWAVKKHAYPFTVYPTYACGNTYVISGNIASRIFETARYLTYLNIEDVFLTGIVRTIIGSDILDVTGFTFWYDKMPQPCEFKNNVRISATKVHTSLQTYIWEELKRKELTNCYEAPDKKENPNIRPEKTVVYKKTLKDEHIFFNETSRLFYVV